MEDCLKPLVKQLNEKRKSLGVTELKFHHDNARPHTAKTVVEYLKNENFSIIDRPPYSPDLAPSDFWLFDRIKSHLGEHLSTQSLVTDITRILASIDKKELQKTNGLIGWNYA